MKPRALLAAAALILPNLLSAANSLITSPTSVAVDSANNLFVVDATKHIVGKISPTGQFSLFAGSPGTQGCADGTGSAASFRQPTGLAIDARDNLYLADTGNSTLRKITAAGVVTTLAGSSTTSGATDGTGTTARFSSPADVFSTAAGTLFVADTGNHTVRQVTSAGVVTTLAGSVTHSGTADGTGNGARFNSPAGIAGNTTGTQLYVSDTTNNAVRATTAAGVVTTLAGTYGVSSPYTDGVGTAATFSGPVGAAVDSAGNIYFADTQNSTIRKITSTGTVTTLAGLSGVAGFKDGTGSDALFNNPRDVTVDSMGNLYVADTGNAAIRKITAAGVVTTVSITASSSSSSSSSSGSPTPPAPAPSS